MSNELNEPLKILEAFSRLDLGTMQILGSQETLRALTEKRNGGGQTLADKLLRIFDKANKKLGARVGDERFLRNGRLFGKEHPCRLVIAQNREEFLALEYFRGNLPEWVGVCGRTYDGEYCVLCDLGWLGKGLRKNRRFFREEMGHEFSHPYLYEIYGNDPKFYLDYTRCPLWIQEAPAEYLTRKDDNEAFIELLARKKLPLIRDMETSFFQHDRSPTRQNICYQGCRWFLDYVVKKTGGLGTILEAVQKAQKEEKTVYESFKDLTGFDFLELEKEWRETLQVKKQTP